MLSYWLTKDAPGFHDSLFGLSGTPFGRAAPSPGGINLYALHSRFAGIHLAGGLQVLLFLLAGAGGLVAFSILRPAGSAPMGLVSFLPAVMVLIFCMTDRIFWWIRRLHDLGLSGGWLLLPIAIAAGVWTGSQYLLASLQEGPRTLALVAMACGAIVILVVALVLMVKLATQPGEPRANRFGPPPAPIPEATLRELGIKT